MSASRRGRRTDSATSAACQGRCYTGPADIHAKWRAEVDEKNDHHRFNRVLVNGYTRSGFVLEGISGGRWGSEGAPKRVPRFRFDPPGVAGKAAFVFTGNYVTGPSAAIFPAKPPTVFAANIMPGS